MTGKSTVTDGEWHHLAAAYRREGSCELYVDGRCEATGDTAPMAAPEVPLLTGGIQYGEVPIGNFTGSVDELMIFASALSADEVAALAGASPDQVRLHHIELNAGEMSAFRVDGHLVSLAPGPARIFRALARSSDAPVDRELLKDALWPDPDEMPDDHDGALNTVMRRLRTAIGDATNDPDAGSDIIRGKGGVYWLQGVVRPCRR